ncbi:MAG: spoIIIJ-associated protein [Candidatus Cloacimonadota bacterium]|nr:spoIIIJ-associated protein [Candidatus Cloacimonadota bacterium]
MNTIDKSGVSVEDIIRKFRSEHNISDHELKYEILKKPNKGFLGLFANKIALVRFQVPDIEDRVRLFCETLLDKMGVSFGSIKSNTEGKTLFLTLEDVGEPGFVIGKNGSMLETIQYLINRVFENEKTIDRIYLDADGYRQRREAQFLSRYIPEIKKVKLHGKSLTLEPMSPGERRIIHRHVERDKGLRTLTIGEGENKRIVIFSAKQKESEVRQQSSPEKNHSNQKPKPRRSSPTPIPASKSKQPQAAKAKPEVPQEQKPRPPRRPRSKPKTNSPAKNA